MITDEEGNSRLSKGSKLPFYYGYVVVASASFIMALTFGINYSFGVFFEPLLTEFGWTKAVTSLAYSFMTLVAGFLGIFAGGLTDRVGVRAVGIAGGCFLGLGFLLLSRMGALWQFYLFYGLVTAAGIGGTWPAFAATVPKWFVKRRGLMTGIFGAGTGLGILLISPLASRIIYTYDWRTAYIVIGVGALVLIVLAGLFLKSDPGKIGRLPYGAGEVKEPSQVTLPPKEFTLREAARTRQFWTVLTIYFCFGVCLHTVMVHIVPHAIELGIPAISAANILAFIGLLSGVGRLTVGGVSDRLRVKPVLVFCLLLLLVTFLWLLIAPHLWMLYLFAIAFGFAYGGVIILQPLLAAELFGFRALGVIIGAISFAYTVGAALGPFMTGYVSDVTGRYTLAFVVCTVLALVAIVLTIVLKPMGQRA